MDKATSPVSTFYVQTNQGIGMVTNAKKKEQAAIEESVSVLCSALLELKSQVTTLTSKLNQLQDTKSSSTVDKDTEVGSEPVTEERQQMLTIEEAAKYLSLSKHTIYKMTAEHQIRFYKPSGKRIYFDVADLTEWMKSRMVKSNAETDMEATNYVMFGNRPTEKPKKKDDERTIKNRQIAQEIRRKYKLG